MGASTITLRGSLPDKQNPSPLELGTAGASVQNVGPKTVYYRDELPVTAFVNDGSIAKDGSASLSGTQYVVVDEKDKASPEDIATLLINPVAQTSESGGGIGLDGSIDGDGNVVVEFTSNWGITGGGEPYFDSDGAAPGEDAIPVAQLDGTLALIQLDGQEA